MAIYNVNNAIGALILLYGGMMVFRKFILYALIFASVFVISPVEKIFAVATTPTPAPVVNPSGPKYQFQKSTSKWSLKFGSPPTAEPMNQFYYLENTVSYLDRDEPSSPVHPITVIWRSDNDASTYSALQHIPRGLTHWGNNDFVRLTSGDHLFRLDSVKDDYGKMSIANYEFYIFSSFLKRNSLFSKMTAEGSSGASFENVSLSQRNDEYIVSLLYKTGSGRVDGALDTDRCYDQVNLATDVGGTYDAMAAIVSGGVGYTNRNTSLIKCFKALDQSNAGSYSAQPMGNFSSYLSSIGEWFKTGDNKIDRLSLKTETISACPTMNMVSADNWKELDTFIANVVGVGEKFATDNNIRLANKTEYTEFINRNKELLKNNSAYGNVDLQMFVRFYASFRSSYPEHRINNKDIEMLSTEVDLSKSTSTLAQNDWASRFVRWVGLEQSSPEETQASIGRKVLNYGGSATALGATGVGLSFLGGLTGAGWVSTVGAGSYAAGRLMLMNPYAIAGAITIGVISTMISENQKSLNADYFVRSFGALLAAGYAAKNMEFWDCVVKKQPEEAKSVIGHDPASVAALGNAVGIMSTTALNNAASANAIGRDSETGCPKMALIEFNMGKVLDSAFCNLSFIITKFLWFVVDQLMTWAISTITG